MWRIQNLQPDEKSNGLGIQRESYKKQKRSISDHLGLRRLVVHKTFQTKIATSVLARAQTVFFVVGKDLLEVSIFGQKTRYNSINVANAFRERQNTLLL